MNIETWAEHHQIYLWSIAMIVSVLGYGRGLLTLGRAVPKGINAVRVANWKLKLNRLINYQQEENVIIKDIILLIAPGTLLVGIGTVVQEVKSWPNGLHRMSTETLLAAPHNLVVANIYLAAVFIQAVLICLSATSLVVLWRYRSPKRRAAALKSRLASYYRESNGVAPTVEHETSELRTTN